MQTFVIVKNTDSTCAEHTVELLGLDGTPFNSGIIYQQGKDLVVEVKDEVPETMLTVVAKYKGGADLKFMVSVRVDKSVAPPTATDCVATDVQLNQTAFSMSVNAAGSLPLHFKLATTDPKTMSIPPALILGLLEVNPSKPHCAQIESVMLAEDATGTPL